MLFRYLMKIISESESLLVIQQGNMFGTILGVILMLAGIGVLFLELVPGIILLVFGLVFFFLVSPVTLLVDSTQKTISKKSRLGTRVFSYKNAKSLIIFKEMNRVSSTNSRGMTSSRMQESRSLMIEVMDGQVSHKVFLIQLRSNQLSLTGLLMAKRGQMTESTVLNKLSDFTKLPITEIDHNPLSMMRNAFSTIGNQNNTI